MTPTCLAWRWQVRAGRWSEAGPARLAVLTAGEPPHGSTRCFDVATSPAVPTTVIVAAAPSDEILAAVRSARPTHLVGYAPVIDRLARSSTRTR